MSSRQCSIDVGRLVTRLQHYAESAGISAPVVHDMVSMLHTPLAAAVLDSPADLLDRWLLDDAYKLRMHKMYATFMSGEFDERAYRTRACRQLTATDQAGVAADFELNVRRMYKPLHVLLEDHPHLASELRQGLRRLEAAVPLDDHLEDVLARYLNSFTVPKVCSMPPASSNPHPPPCPRSSTASAAPCRRPTGEWGEPTASTPSAARERACA
jgi:hypothetical protein